MKAEFPRSIDSGVRFIDRYTVWDLLLTAVLVLIGWTVAAPYGTFVGAALGVVFAEVTSDGKRMVKKIVDGLRDVLGSQTVVCPEVSTVRDGSVVLDDGSVVGIVEVSSCDVEHLPEPERRANRDVVTELLDGLEYKIEVHSQQRFVDLLEYNGPGDTAVTTDHYVVVRTSASDAGKGHREINDRCAEVRNTLTAADLYAERLTGSRLKTAVKRLYFGEAEISQGSYEVEYSHRPVCRMIYVSEYPEQLSLGWVGGVLDVETPGLIDAVQVIDPVSDRQRSWMNRILARTDAELSASWKPFRRATLQQQKHDLEDLIEADASGESLVNYGVYFVARGETGAEAEETLEGVQAALNQRRIDTGEPGLHLDRGIHSVSAFHYDRLDKKEIVPGYSAASGFSFAAYDTVEAEGIVVGEDHRNEMPAVLDRFAWDAGHISVMGKIGSGKSYWTALMLLRSAQRYDDLEIYVIDPKKRDYGDIVDVLRGETVVIDNEDLKKSRSGNVIRYTVSAPSRDNTAKLAETVRHVYREASKTDSKSLVVIDEAHRIITRGNEIYRDGLQAVSELVRESRHRNIAVTLVTQNADEFTRSSEGENILRNIDCNLFFKQREVDSQIADFFHLSERETSDLRKLRTGTKLPFSEALIRGPVNTRLRIKATDAEHEVIENGINPGSGSKVMDRGQVSDTQDIDHSPSGIETDGGHGSKNPEPTNLESEKERSRLATVLSLTFAGPIGLLEYGLAAGVLASVFLFLTGNLQPFLPIDIFPPQMVLFTNILPVIMTVEVLWVVVLSFYRWIAQ